MARRKILTDEELEALLYEFPLDTDTSFENSSEESENEYCSSQKQQKFDITVPSTSGVQEDDSSEGSENEGSDKLQCVTRNFRKRESVSTVPLFTLQKGAVQQFFADKTAPTDIFLTIVTEKTIHDLIYQSNLYIQQLQRNVCPITEQDMYGFFGLQFLFGYRHYWCSDMDLIVPVVPQTMTRERYKQILSNLHVNDNQTMPTNTKDRLYKVRPLIVAMNESFQKHKLPDQYQSIDESMVRFKGRSSLKQYNPMKPVKRGYKLCCRADMSGYIYEFDVYQGKTGDEAGKKRFGLGGSVVDKLTSSLHHGNYIIMMDNYFTSLELFEYLKSQDIYACGTVRPNRIGLPKLTNDKQLKRGEFDFRVSDQEITYFKRRDNRCVHFLSNYHGSEVTKVKRTQKDGTKIDVQAPDIVNDYNCHMGGVDKADMLRSLYDSNKRSKKWWHRLFFAILEIALVNSFIIYTELYGQLPFLQFKRQVTQGLLAKGRLPTKKRGRPKQDTSTMIASPPLKRRKGGFSVSNDIRLQNRGGHWPEFVAQRARCEYCASKKIESWPHSRCTLCKVFLCVNEKKNCFFDFHHA